MIGENILTYLMDKGLNEMASYGKLCQTFGQAGEEICGILDDRFKDDDSFYYDRDRFDMSHMCMLAEKVQGAALDQADRIIWNYAYTIFLGQGVTESDSNWIGEQFRDLVFAQLSHVMPDLYGAIMGRMEHRETIDKLGQIEINGRHGAEKTDQLLAQISDLNSKVDTINTYFQSRYIGVEEGQKQESATPLLSDQSASNTVRQHIGDSIPVNDKEIEWKLQNLGFGIFHSNNGVDKVIEVWESEFKSYPGWYVMPYSYAKQLHDKTEAVNLIYQINKMPVEKALRYINLYMWRCDKAMMSLYNRDLKIIYQYWLEKMNMICSEQEQHDPIYNVHLLLGIGAYLLVEYREELEKDSWTVIYELCQEAMRKFPEETERREYVEQIFWFERAAWLFSNCQYQEVQQEFKQHVIRSEDYEIRHAVIYMKLELGDYECAMHELEQLIRDIEAVIPSCDNAQEDNVFHASMLAVLYHMYLLQLRAQSALKQKNCVEDKNYQNYYTLYSRWKEYFDFEVQITEVMQSYLNWNVGLQRKNALPFDVHRKTVHLIESGIDGTGSGYYLYRYLRRCGIPRQSHHMYFLNKDYELVMNQYLLYCAPMIAIQSMLLGAHKEQIKILLTHRQLWQLGYDIVGKMTNYVINAMVCNMSQFEYHTGWYEQDIYGLIVENGMQLLSQLVVFCSDEQAKQILTVMAGLSSADLPGTSVDLDSFICTVNENVPEYVKAESLAMLAASQIRKRQLHSGRVDPVDVMDGLWRKERALPLFKAQRLKEDVVEHLLDMACYTEKRTMAVNRLMILYRMGHLSKKQSDRLGRLIWKVTDEKTGLPALPDLYCYQYLMYPSSENVDVKDLIRHYFLEHDWIAELHDGSGVSMTFGHIRYFTELIQYLQYMRQEHKKAFTKKQSKILIQNIKEYWELPIVKKRMDMHPDRYGDEYMKRKQVMDRCLIMLGAYDDWEEMCDNPYDLCYDKDHISVTLQRLSQRMFWQKPKQKMLKKVVLLLCQLASMSDEIVAVSAVNTLHNLVYSGTLQYEKELWKKLDRLLIYFNHNLKYDTHLSEAQFNRLICLREAVSGLAYIIYQYNREHDLEEMTGVQDWYVTCVGGNEFAEVRVNWCLDKEHRILKL